MRTDFRDLRLWYASRFKFDVFLLRKLDLDGRTGLAQNGGLSDCIAFSQVRIKDFTSFSICKHISFFVKFSMSKNRLKPLETAWNRLKELLSGSKRFKVVESDLKYFKALPQNAYSNFPPLFEPPFYLRPNFLIFSSATFFFREILYVEKVLETAWDWLKALYEKRLKLTESALDRLKPLHGGLKRLTKKRF